MRRVVFIVLGVFMAAQAPCFLLNQLGDRTSHRLLRKGDFAGLADVWLRPGNEMALLRIVFGLTLISATSAALLWLGTRTKRAGPVDFDLEPDPCQEEHESKIAR